MPIRAKRNDSHPGEYYNHVPATIDEDFWQAEMTPEQRKAVREGGLYDVRTDAEMKPSGQTAPKGG